MRTQRRIIYRGGKPSSSFPIESANDDDASSEESVPVRSHKRRKSGIRKKKAARMTIRKRIRGWFAEVWNEISHFLHIWIIYPVGAGSFLIVLGMAAWMLHEHEANLAQDRQTRLNNMVVFADPGAHLAIPRHAHHKK